MKINFRHFSFRKIAFFILLFLFVDTCFVYSYYLYVNKWVAQHATCEDTFDTALVFFHSVDETKHTLTQGSIERLTSALHLFKDNKVSNIIVAGGNRKKRDYPNINQPSGATLMARWLTKKGIPSKRILIDSCSYDTVSNIENALRLKKKQQLNSMTCISSPLHLFRIQYLLETSQTKAGICALSSSEEGLFEIYLGVHQEWVAFFLMKWFDKKDYLEFIQSRRRVEVIDC